MGSQWKCLRCSTRNGADAFKCVHCGLLRGSAVPASFLTDVPPTVEPGAVPVGNSAIPESPTGGTQGQDATPSAWVQPEPVRVWRRLLPFAIATVIFLAMAGAGWYFAAQRSSTGEIERSGDLAASELRVGDCFDLKDPEAGEVEDVAARPCGEEHEYEVYFVGTMAEGAYPANPDDAFSTYLKENCLPAFNAYVGKDYYDSELEIFWFYPMEEAWADGDRSIQCAVYHPRVHRLTGSLQDSMR